MRVRGHGDGDDERRATDGKNSHRNVAVSTLAARRALVHGHRCVGRQFARLGVSVVHGRHLGARWKAAEAAEVGTEAQGTAGLSKKLTLRATKPHHNGEGLMVRGYMPAALAGMTSMAAERELRSAGRRWLTCYQPSRCTGHSARRY